MVRNASEPSSLVTHIAEFDGEKQGLPTVFDSELQSLLNRMLEGSQPA